MGIVFLLAKIPSTSTVACVGVTLSALLRDRVRGALSRPSSSRPSSPSSLIEVGSAVKSGARTGRSLDAAACVPYVVAVDHACVVSADGGTAGGLVSSAARNPTTPALPGRLEAEASETVTEPSRLGREKRDERREPRELEAALAAES